MDILKEVNWGILAFMIGIFIVVLGLRNVGAIDFYRDLFLECLKLPTVFSILLASIIVTISASILNNWPMTLLGMLSINEAMSSQQLTSQESTGLIFSNIIGNNLGPHFFPLGSLAILMWMDVMKRKGVQIRLRDYLKVGSVLSIIEVFIASFILWFEIYLFNLFLNI